MIESNKLMNLADGKLLYDDLRNRIEEMPSADPSTIIDDTSGSGITNKTWSANKINGEFELQVGNINVLLATI